MDLKQVDLNQEDQGPQAILVLIQTSCSMKSLNKRKRTLLLSKLFSHLQRYTDHLFSTCREKLTSKDHTVPLLTIKHLLSAGQAKQLQINLVDMDQYLDIMWNQKRRFQVIYLFANLPKSQFLISTVTLSSVRDTSCLSSYTSRTANAMKLCLVSRV